MKIQTLSFLFWVEGVGGYSHFPLKEFNYIFRVLLFSHSIKIAFQRKQFFHIVYCSPFILYICPFCFVILSMGSMSFTLVEFVTIEEYIKYIHFSTLLVLAG